MDRILNEVPSKTGPHDLTRYTSSRSKTNLRAASAPPCARLPKMNCGICHRTHHAQKLPFFCAVDGRNRLYEGRIKHAKALIENEGLEQQINSMLSNPTPSVSDVPGAKSVRIERIKSEEAQAADRTSQIIAQADRLRVEVEAAKREIEERKQKVARRKEDLVEASNGISARRSRQLEDTERSVQMFKYKWNRSFESMAATRSFLCMEAARLYGLRRVKKSNKFELGGIEMIELPGMISMFPSRHDPPPKLTMSRCIARGCFNLTRTHCPHPHAGFALPVYSFACRNHSSSP